MELPLVPLSAESFFATLPSDWREQIEPFWSDYEGRAAIWGFEKDRQVIAGGIVFKSPSPDAAPYKAEAQKLFDAGYLYIGFLWVDPAYRGRGYGTGWMQSVLQQYSPMPFWIAIEEKSLSDFYERMGFLLRKSVQGAHGEEWIYTLESNK